MIKIPKRTVSMELTEERKQLYDLVLHTAKNYLNDDVGISLLNAVSRVRVGAATPMMCQACDDIARHILDLLKGHSSLEEWLLLERGIDVHEDCDDPQYLDYQLQQTNLRWAQYLRDHLTDIKPEAKPKFTVIDDPNAPPPAPAEDLADIMGEDDDDFDLKDII